MGKVSEEEAMQIHALSKRTPSRVLNKSLNPKLIYNANKACSMQE